MSRTPQSSASRIAFATRVFAKLAAIALYASAVALLPLSASALILTGQGNKPVHDAGWPEGALAVANLESRVGWWEGPPFGGGEWHFLYRGDTGLFVETLTNFAAIQAPVLEVVVHNGPEQSPFLKDEKDPQSASRVDWEFTVWVPANWHRLFNNPKSVWNADHPNFRQPVPPPRLDVHLGGDGGVDWSKVKVPANIRVRDDRASVARIDPASGTVLRATVLDMASGKPVSGARVTLDRAAPAKGMRETHYDLIAEGVADERGFASIEQIPAGTHRVWVSAEGYAPRMVGYERFRERSLKECRVELTTPADISGVVRDTEGQAIEGVEVRASNTMGIDGRGYTLPQPAKTVTDQEGRFELKGLPCGYAQIRASSPDFYDGDIFTIHDVPSTNAVLRLSRAGSIEVSVTDKDGQPLATLKGAPVRIEIEPSEGGGIGKWGGSAKVNDGGMYEFTKVPPGVYRVTSHPNPSTVGKRYAEEQIVSVLPGARISVRLVYE